MMFPVFRNKELETKLWQCNHYNYLTKIQLLLNREIVGFLWQKMTTILFVLGWSHCASY